MQQYQAHMRYRSFHSRMHLSEYEEVVLIGKNGNEIISADDMAQMIGTIGYEIVCDVGKRVPRVYI